MAIPILLLSDSLVGQPTGERTITANVTYVAGTSVYIGAGRTQSLAVGDTGVVMRGTPGTVRVVVGAVSSGSSVARLLNPDDSVAVGDSVVFRKRDASAENFPGVGAPAPVARSSEPATAALTRGRVSLQYVGWGDLGSDADNARASLVVALDAGRLFGTGFRFTMYGRLTSVVRQDPSSQNSEGKWNARVYDMSVSLDDPNSWFGVGLGRITSRYAGGIGIVDGTQLTARTGALTFGVLGGFQPDYRTSEFNTDYTKGLLFLNAAWGSRVHSPGSTTFAYGTQYYKGSLDRDYLYVQNTFSFNSRLYLYQSSEIDLHTESGGELQQAFRLTNTFITVNYLPASWVTITAAYDANRPVDFFESMKLIPDSLFEKDLRQGFRAGAFFRLPVGISLSATGGYRLPVGDQPAGYNAGGGVRMSDIARSGFSAGARYQKVRGIYTDGSDITVELDQSIAGNLFLGLRFDSYTFTQLEGSERSTITTASVNLNWLIARSWYATLTGDRVWNTGQDLYRLFAEFGIHF